ncbi:MAG: isocitrate/isopropylmalate family dehydrogenase [Bryobacterales bacterium]
MIAATVEVLRTVEERFDSFRLECEQLGGCGRVFALRRPDAGATYRRLEQLTRSCSERWGCRTCAGRTAPRWLAARSPRAHGTYAGLRPIKLYHRDFTPLKGYEAGEIDFVILRENTEGLFHSRKGSLQASDEEMIDGLRISRRGSERLFRKAFEQARKRRGKSHWSTSRTCCPRWRFFGGSSARVAAQNPDVETETIYIDASTLYLVQRPETFDVVVTENMFGDILSDLAAGLVGGMGMAPSGDVGDEHAVFQLRMAPRQTSRAKDLQSDCDDSFGGDDARLAGRDGGGSDDRTGGASSAR